MPFALDGNPSQSEISEAVNYLLSNFVGNVTADPNTGQIVGPQGIVVAYLYRYLSVRYADSFDGQLNFSNTPTNRGYYGVNNSNSSTESTNYADYIWYKVAGGFGTTKFLYYQSTGGRAINFVVDTTSPGTTYIQDTGAAIDLDIVTSGTQANSATTAYLVQDQSYPAPSGFPLYTSGSSLPPGWSANLGTVSVGQVAWYSFGRYNGSTVAVDGIPANSTYWSVPVAASIFQDIRSDNWNGSTPPTYGNSSTYGTAGYYIQRSTGDAYFNNGVFRADVDTTGQGKFQGKTNGTYQIRVAGSFYTLVPSVAGEADNTSAPPAGSSRVGVYGLSGATGTGSGQFNVGVAGLGWGGGGAAGGIGVVGEGNSYGGFFSSTFGSGIGLTAYNPDSAGVALEIAGGVLNYRGTIIDAPPGSTAYLLRGNGTWGSADPICTAANTNSGTANVSSNLLNLLGSTSTGIAGAYVGTSASGNTVTFTVQTTSPSDVRLKEEVEDVDVGLAFVKQLRPVSYKLKADPKHQKGYGFIADEVEQLGVYGSSLVYEEPDWKVGDEIGFKTIHYPSYIAVLTKAIQELSAEVEALKAKVNG